MPSGHTQAEIKRQNGAVSREQKPPDGTKRICDVRCSVGISTKTGGELDWPLISWPLLSLEGENGLLALHTCMQPVTYDAC